MTGLTYSKNPSNENLELVRLRPGSYVVPEGESWAVWQSDQAKEWLEKPQKVRGCLIWSGPGKPVSIVEDEGLASQNIYMCAIVQRLNPKNEFGEVFP